MFDFSFAELLVIGVVALVVIGPERMPKVARTAGLLFGRAQRYVTEVKADINNQLKLEELRKIEADMRAKASSAEYEIIEETRHVEQEFKGMVEQIEPVVETPSETPPAVPVEAPDTKSAQLELGLDTVNQPPEAAPK